MESQIEIRHYVTPAGRDVFGDWFLRLSDFQARDRIAARIDRLAHGNFGDCRRLRHGLWELRVDSGPGYRIYFAMLGAACVLLLCGGDKRKQSSDIERALRNMTDFKQRTVIQ
jgi:putative addiction module killer protein